MFTPVFSPDSRRVAYRVAELDHSLVVVDGVEGNSYPGPFAWEPGSCDPVFSPDSRRVAYRAQAGDNWMMVVDGKPGTEYQELGVPVFSPDSRRLAYTAYRQDYRRVMVVDGEEGAPCDGIESGVDLAGGPSGGRGIFSPDGQHLAYVAQKGRKSVMVIDGTESSEYDTLMVGITFRGEPAGCKSPFSPDGRRVGYEANRGDSWYAVVDGREGKPYGATLAGDTLFSPDSQRAVYTATGSDKSRWFVVVDNTESEARSDEQMSSLVFDAADTFHLLTRQENEFFLIEGEIGEVTPASGGRFSG